MVRASERPRPAGAREARDLPARQRDSARRRARLRLEPTRRGGPERQRP